MSSSTSVSDFVDAQFAAGPGRNSITPFNVSSSRVTPPPAEKQQSQSSNSSSTFVLSLLRYPPLYFALLLSLPRLLLPSPLYAFYLSVNQPWRGISAAFIFFILANPQGPLVCAVSAVARGLYGCVFRFFDGLRGGPFRQEGDPGSC